MRYNAFTQRVAVR